MISFHGQSIGLHINSDTNLEELKHHFKAAAQFCGFNCDDIELVDFPTPEDLELKVVVTQDDK